MFTFCPPKKFRCHTSTHTHTLTHTKVHYVHARFFCFSLLLATFNMSDDDNVDQAKELTPCDGSLVVHADVATAKSDRVLLSKINDLIVKATTNGEHGVELFLPVVHGVPVGVVDTLRSLGYQCYKKNFASGTDLTVTWGTCEECLSLFTFCHKSA